MLFNSIPFLFFLPIVVLLFYLLKHKYRWVLLLLASYFFYASWKVEFLGLIVLSTTVDYFVSRAIANSSKKFRKKMLLFVSIGINLLILVVFKYFNFFIGEQKWYGNLIADSAQLVYWSEFFKYALPVGISFYTFQTISYTIDVYRGEVEPEKNYFKFALFVSYFPQLVAGPIERFNRLRNQIFSEVELNYTNFVQGFQLILYGFFTKMVVADNLAVYANQVFEAPKEFNSGSLFIGLVSFTVQIYADFYGYSTIAQGVAKLFGVNLMDNFKTPFFSSSIKEFWSRWHISLSTWFRDYLYIPLGGNKKGKFRWVFAIVMVFGISGLWHGAEMGFIIWGCIHGMAYLIETFVGKYISFQKNVVLRLIGNFLTLSVVVFSFIYFRSQSMQKSGLFWDLLLNGNTEGNVIVILPSLFFILIIFALFEILIHKKRFDLILANRNVVVRLVVYVVLFCSILFLSPLESSSFIYFKF